MEIIKCPSCGEKVEAKVNYCDQCGYKINVAGAAIQKILG